MVASLPGNVRLKLQQTLAQWRQWHCEPALSVAPEVLSILTHGLSNFSILVESGQRFVVRIDGINPASHSLNRQGEWHSLDAAHRAGLAPAPRYFNPELGCLVCDYLEPDQLQPKIIEDVALLLREIHRLPARHHRLDLAERILSYEKRLAHHDPARAAQLAAHGQAVTATLDGLKGNTPISVLCHHDLLQANRLYSGGRLFALDWEYGAMGDAWYDLAVVAAGDELTEHEIDTLLQTYLDRTPETAERERVMRYSNVYRYLELLWYVAQDHADLAESELERKLQKLAVSLKQV